MWKSITGERYTTTRALNQNYVTREYRGRLVLVRCPMIRLWSQGRFIDPETGLVPTRPGRSARERQRALDLLTEEAQEMGVYAHA